MTHAVSVSLMTDDLFCLRLYPKLFAKHFYKLLLQFYKSLNSKCQIRQIVYHSLKFNLCSCLAF